MDIQKAQNVGVNYKRVHIPVGKDVAEATQPLKPLETPKDVATLSSVAKTSDGKVPLIISSKDKNILKAEKTLLRGIRAKVKDELPIINGFTVEVDEKDLPKLLEHKPEGVSIYIDGKYKMIEDPIVVEKKEPEVSIQTNTATKVLGMDKLWEKGLTGKGGAIAVLDTGIYPHKDFGNRIIGFKDFCNGYKEPYDDNGHGTHVAGDCAGDGTMSNGLYKGTAPEANLVGVKCLDKHGAGRFSDIIKGIQWIIKNKDKYNIKVLNMSLGGPVFASYKDDPICQAVEKVLEAGIIPVIAAGNSGPKAFTIGSPGNDPNVLTIGAFDDNNTVERYDDKIAKFSSRGPTKFDKLTKPDVLSPGVNITAPTSYGSVLDTYPNIPHAGPDYITISGTSMATPISAGVVHAFAMKFPNIPPRKWIEIFKKTAKRFPGLDANQQGYGVIQPLRAYEVAKNLSSKAD